jgi:GST-like protein
MIDLHTTATANGYKASIMLEEVGLPYRVAEKTGKLLPASPAARAKAYEWLGIVSSDLAPAYSGQFVFNVIAPDKNAWAIDFYDRLCLRLLGPLESRLGTSRFLAGDSYSIADVIAYPVAAVSMKRFPGGLGAHPHIARWATEVGARPAVQRGMKVPR